MKMAKDKPKVDNTDHHEGKDELLDAIDYSINSLKAFMKPYEDGEVRFPNLIKRVNALQQLREIVEGHFKPLNLIEEAEKRRMVLLSKDMWEMTSITMKNKDKQIEYLIRQQKPRVSREWVFSLITDVRVHFEMNKLKNPCRRDMAIADVVEKRLKEIGVEVGDGER
jgi:hypothetical protein